MNRVNVRRGFRGLFSKSATLFGLLFLALFAQLASAQGPLNYFQNYFVTGDYVVGGVGLYNQGANPTGTINFSGVPCTSGPGLLASVVPCSAKGAVPADIIAAFLYWETIEPTSLTTPSATAGTFDGAANTIAGLPLGNPQIDACVVGGGTQSKTSYARVYRADVLRYLVINASANVRTANYTHTITFTGNTSPTQFLGATLVVVYRLVTPGNPNITPLRSVVIYDGAFTGIASRSPSLNQTMGGFYQAAPNDNARMTHIVGGGQKGFSETLTVNGSIPQGVPSNPFVGAQGGDWDNYTFNYNLPSNASSVQTTVQSTNDCLSWAAIITSTNVQDSDSDGLLDVWETSGLNLNPGVRNDGTTTAPVPATFGTCAQSPTTCVNFPAMGANPFQPDIFVQIDWMQSTGLSVPDHVHIPQLAALNMVGSTFKSHGINLHFDVGNNYQASPVSPYIIPAKYALGGNVIPESTVLCQNSGTCGFYPQSADYSVLGWKTGFGAIKDGDPDFLNSAGNPQPLPQLFARNRKDSFHYALFAHAIAATTPLSAPAAGSISGVADLPGGDLMITLGLWRSDTPGFDQTGTLLEQAGTLMHELGHNLGLGHAGWTDTPVCKPDYPSVMNYLYQVQGLTDAAGNEHLDYSYGLELPLAESLLIPNFPLGIQTYRVRYFGPLNSKTNTPGQASAVFCTGNLLTGTEGKYVRLESPTVSTPDWSNGLVASGKPLGPLDINYDGATNGIFTDSPDWISLDLQQVGARPTGDAVSLDLGRSDLGRSDLGRSDLGRSDLGRSDLGTSALGQDALGDEDYVTYALSGLNPPTSLTGTVITTTPPSGNPNPGGTGVQLKWLPASGVAYDHYNVYLCNATSSAACTPTTLTASVPGGTPTPTDTVFVNDFVDAGATCPATSICYNTPYNFFVTGVVVVGNLSNESPGSNTIASQVNHLFVVGNITPQSIVYGTANPAIATNIYGNVSGSLPVSQVTCVYSPSAPRNVMSAPYSIVCSGPATVTGSPTDGVTYNISYLGHSASTLTITPRPITVKAAASTKVYNGTTVSASIPTITTGTLAYSADIAAFTESYDNQNVGTTHVMTPAGIVNDGNGGSNYTVTFVTINTGVITPSPLTASITASIVGTPTKPYDGTTTATLTPANYALSGLAPGENFTVTQTAGTYNSANVLTATTVTASLTPANFTPVGATLASNYTFPTTASGAGKITAVPLTASIIGNPTKPYDGTATATLTSANFSLSPLVGTESFTVTTTVGTYNSPNVLTAATVTASPTSGNFTPGAATLASNYVLPATATGPGKITPVNANITVTHYSVTYDGNPHTAAGTATGVGTPAANLNADLSLSNTTHTNAGTYTADFWSFTDPIGNYNPVASATITDTILKATANITITPYNVTYNGNPQTATGTATGVETPTPTNLSAGLTLGGTTHTNAGTYPSDPWTFTDFTGNYNNASGTVSDVINQATPTVTDSGPAPTTPDYGQPVTLTVTVAPPQSGEMPTGVVTFSFTLNTVTNYICSNGTISTSTPACTVPLALVGSNYVATVTTTSNLPTGAENVMATYSGDPNFLGEPANNLSVAVSQANSGVTLTKSTDPSTYGTPVNLTVEVVDATQGSIGVPTGTVALSFKLDPTDPNGQVYYICADGSLITTACVSPNQITLAPDPMNPNGATVTLQTSSLPAGLATFANPGANPPTPFSYPINATYSGDTNFAASAPFGLSQTVNPLPVTATAGNYSGTYNATTQSPSACIVTPISPSTSTGTLTCTNSPTSVGPNAGSGTVTPVPAVGTGDSLNNYAITSVNGSWTIGQATTTTTISSVNPSPATVGQPVTVAVAVVPVAPGSGTPTGTVTVSSPGASSSCTVTLPANNCMLTFSSSGSQSVSATYNGDSNFKSSPSSAFPVTVNPASLGNQVNYSTSQTGTVTITPLGGPFPASGGFCVGPNSDNCVGSGLSGSVAITANQVSFTFYGSTESATGTFVLVLSGFSTTINSVTFNSGALQSGTFALTSFNSNSMTFTGTTSNGFAGLNGVTITFNVS